MAKHCDPAPSLDDVFNILSRLPEERLLSLWYKFNPDNSNTFKEHCLLYSIISFTLRKNEEAEKAVKSVLNERSTDKSALYIYNRIQGLVDAPDGEKKPPPSADLSAEDRSFLADLALMFVTIEEEKLCSPSVRNRACQAAVNAFKSNRQDCSIELQELVEKFRSRFGFLDFEDEAETVGISALKSIQEHNHSKVTTMAFKTRPVTIPSQATVNVYSTSEMTLPSHFEISASPTASFTTEVHPNDLESSVAIPDHCTISSGNIITVGSNNVNIPSSDNCFRKGEVAHSIGGQQPDEQDPVSLGSAEISSGDKVNEVGPSECTGINCSDQIVTSKFKMSQVWNKGTGNSTNSQEMAKSKPNVQSSVSDKPRPSGEPSEAMAESFKDAFYPFVILHVPEDAEIAEHVRDRLESLGVKGTTIDDISVPGQSQIKCIEDAVNNSAFTILLLTKNFNTQWADYETNVTLMDSINNEHKYNTVVPLLPKRNPLPQDKIPFALSATVSLKENSRHFEKQVKKIFAKEALDSHRRGWLQRQKQKEIKSKTNQIKKDIQVAQDTLSNQVKYMNLYSQLLEMRKNCQLVAPISQPQPGIIQDQPLLNLPLYPNIPTPPPFFNPISSMSQIQPCSNPTIPSPYLSSTPSNSERGQNVSLDTAGQGTNIIQIHHARNIQIGDCNQMTVTECTAFSENSDEEEEDGNHSRHV
ncbi:TIR domain-containing adapter molecule 1 [Hypanus sabinus]|uniref:TIR domain-containing adapter molecule 1 n=1 Tax=Hypanus sabinus TaxID=79690 RepID=UPI0028C40408|nr:TIR domain-containing adapter molecule 1 [Hypanus sabinus]